MVFLQGMFYSKSWFPRMSHADFQDWWISLKRSNLGLEIWALHVARFSGLLWKQSAESVVAN